MAPQEQSKTDENGSSSEKAMTMNALLREEAKKSAGNIAFSIAVVTGSAFQIAAVSMKTTAGAIFYFTQRVNDALDRNAEYQQQKTNAYNQLSDYRQRQILLKTIEQETVRELVTMHEAQKEYLKNQDKFVRDCIDVLMRRTCPKGHIYGYNCAGTSVVASLTDDLNALTGTSLASLSELNALKATIRPSLSNELQSTAPLRELEKECQKKMSKIIEAGQIICNSVYDEFTKLGSVVRVELMKARKMPSLQYDSNQSSNASSTSNALQLPVYDSDEPPQNNNEDTEEAEEQRAGKRRKKSRGKKVKRSIRKHRRSMRRPPRSLDTPSTEVAF